MKDVSEVSQFKVFFVLMRKEKDPESGLRGQQLQYGWDTDRLSGHKAISPHGMGSSPWRASLSKKTILQFSHMETALPQLITWHHKNMKCGSGSSRLMYFLSSSWSMNVSVADCLATNSSSTAYELCELEKPF